MGGVGGDEGDDERLVLLGVDISQRPRFFQFMCCCAGVFLFFLGYGYVQEAIFRVEGFKSGWYLTAVQFLFYSILSGVSLMRTGAETSSTPFRVYLSLSVMTVGTMGLSNASLGSLNYPTSVIFKSSKVVPVMLAGIVIQRKRYTLLDYVGAFMIVLGLICFNLADVSVRPEFPLRGTAAMGCALCFDAMIGNFQEHWMKLYKMSSTEMINRCYSLGFVLCAVISVMSGDWDALSNVSAGDYPRLHFLMALFSVLGYFGVDFVIALIRHFGAVVAVTVTSCRKAGTIIISFLLFPKPFAPGYVYGGLLVLGGIAVNVIRKNPDECRRAAIRILFAVPGASTCCGGIGPTLIPKTASKEKHDEMVV